MPYSSVTYTANGTDTDFLITWNYLDTDHIRVKVGGVLTTDGASTHQFSLVDSTTVRVTDLSSNPVASGLSIEVLRETPITSRAVTFAEGSALRTTDLNKNSDFLLYSMQEAIDTIDVAAQEGAATAQTGAEAAQAAAEAAQVAAEAAQAAAEGAEAGVAADEAAATLAASGAATSEANAATSETNAAASAAAAATSEANAATSETNAAASAASITGDEAAAAASAAAAATSETNAAASAATADAALDTFNDQYLGSLASDPTVDNDGDPLVQGALYWNTTASNMRVYNGSSWEVISTDFVSATLGGTFSGNVGIGTSPSHPLHVKTSTDGSGLSGDDKWAAIIQNAEATDGRSYGLKVMAGSTTDQAFAITDHDGSNDLLAVQGNGNVGIGTSSPSQKLEVSGGSGDVNAVVSTAGASNQAGLTLSNGTRSFRIISDGSGNALKIYDDTAGAERMRITSGGNVGIGTSSPQDALHIAKASAVLRLEDTDTSHTSTIQSGGSGLIISADAANTVASSYMGFSVDGSERMRLDQSGKLLVGKSTYNNNDNGAAIVPSGTSWFTATNDYPLGVNRKSSDGTLITFTKNGTTVGSIGITAGDNMYFQGSSGHVGFESTGAGLVPWEGGSSRDNVYDLGTSAARWDDVYATNGTIQTSDINEKQDIELLSEAEQRVAVACKGLLRKFRWKDSVAEKGEEARIHFGIMAQNLQSAFEAEGLDAGDYAMFTSTTWWETQTEVPAVEAVDEVLDDEGNVVTEAVESAEAYTRTDTYFTAEEAPEGATERTRLGVRYPELLAFIIAAI